MPHSLHPGTRRLYARLVAPVLLSDYEDLIADLPPDAAVLDVGCGPGLLVAALARRHPHVRFHGIDLDPEQVRLACRLHRGIPNASFHHGRGRHLPFADHVFDAALATESLHHWRHRSATLAEIHRVLRPGGRLWVLEDRGRSSWPEAQSRLGLPRWRILRPLVRRNHRRNATAGRTSTRRSSPPSAPAPSAPAPSRTTDAGGASRRGREGSSDPAVTHVRARGLSVPGQTMIRRPIRRDCQSIPL